MATASITRGLAAVNARWAPLRLARIAATSARIRTLTSLAPAANAPTDDLAAIAGLNQGPKSDSTATHNHKRSHPSIYQPAAAAAKALPPAPIPQISQILAAKRLRNAAPALRLVLDWLRMAELKLLDLPEEARILAPARWIAHERRKVMQEVFANFASVPVARMEARVMLDKMKEEGVVPSSRGLTIYIKTMLETLGRIPDAQSRSSSIPSSSSAHDIPFSKPPLSECNTGIRGHLDEIFSLQPTLDLPLLATILSAHIRIGTPTSTILDTITACMASGGAKTKHDAGAVGAWSPALFGLMIQAHKRDGDMKGAMQWYLEFRRSRRESLAREARGGFEQERDESDDSAEKPRERDTDKAPDTSRRWHQKALAWPYTAFYDAICNPPTHRAGLLGSRSGMIVRLLACIRQDQVNPTPRLLEVMIRQARVRGSRTAAIACWNLFARSRAMSKRQPEFGPIIEILRVMTMEGRAGPDRVPLEPIIGKVFPAGLDDTTKRNLLRDADPGKARTLLTQLIAVALSPAYLNFELAHKLAKHFGTHGLRVTSETVDTLAKSMLLHLVRRKSSAGWCRAVFGKGTERFGSAGWQRGRSRKRMRDRSLGKLQLTSGHWTLLVRRLAALESSAGGNYVSTKDSLKELVVPISWPLAKLVKQPSGTLSHPFAISRTSHDYLQQRDQRRNRGEAEMKDRVWGALRELMRTAAEYRAGSHVEDGSKQEQIARGV